MPTLDQLVSRARTAQLADDDARAYVAELGRWARVPEPRRAWTWWFAGAFALAAAAAVILFVVGRRPPQQPGAVRIGERVAIVAENGAVYRVAAADATHTEIDVESGTVTARLFHADGAHELTLAGGGVRAHAVGTIYSLSVENGRGAVDVQQGTVRVEHGADTTSVPAGASWPPSAPHHAPASEMLGALDPLPPSAPPPVVAIDAAVIEVPADASPDVTDAEVAIAPRVQDAAPKATLESDAATTLSVTDRWRRARLMRGQGDFAGAIADCIAIADAKDATWSPIALLEAARIELGPRASPERAITLAERLIHDWPAHQLVPEARDLRCRALRQLGRDADCAGAP